MFMFIKCITRFVNMTCLCFLPPIGHFFLRFPLPFRGTRGLEFMFLAELNSASAAADSKRFNKILTLRLHDEKVGQDFDIYFIGN